MSLHGMNIVHVQEGKSSGCQSTSEYRSSFVDVCDLFFFVVVQGLEFAGIEHGLQNAPCDVRLEIQISLHYHLNGVFDSPVIGDSFDGLAVELFIGFGMIRSVVELILIVDFFVSVFADRFFSVEERKDCRVFHLTFHFPVLLISVSPDDLSLELTSPGAFAWSRGFAMFQ